MQAKDFDLPPSFSENYFGSRLPYKKIKSQWSAEWSLHFLGDSGFNKVWIGLREVDNSYIGDSVKVLSVLIIIAQRDMKQQLEKTNCFGKHPFISHYYLS